MTADDVRLMKKQSAEKRLQLYGAYLIPYLTI
jgi:hypothetical protein